jgi:hypothetical protein
MSQEGLAAVLLVHGAASEFSMRDPGESDAMAVRAEISAGIE